MIETFQRKGLHDFFETGNKAGIQPDHTPRLATMLCRLNETANVQGMDLPVIFDGRNL